MGKFFISSEEKGMKEKSLFDLIDESTQKEKLSPGQFFCINVNTRRCPSADKSLAFILFPPSYDSIRHLNDIDDKN